MSLDKQDSGRRQDPGAELGHTRKQKRISKVIDLSVKRK